MYCLHLLLGCVPNFLVHAGGFLASVFCHSSDGKNFAVIRVGQQSLQGSHLAPSADLRCLRDTHLESANVPRVRWPSNGVPLPPSACARTTTFRSPHLLSLID